MYHILWRVSSLTVFFTVTAWLGICVETSFSESHISLDSDSELEYSAVSTASNSIVAPWRPSNLRVERLIESEALGIDVARPTFSWIWESSEISSQHMLRQSKLPLPHDITITVGLTDILEGGAYGVNVWETTLDKTTTSVQYNGPQLPPAARIQWRVCVKSGSLQVFNEIDPKNETRSKFLPQETCNTANFVTGLTTSTSWGGAQWLAGRQLRSPVVTLPTDAVSVIVAASGLGFYELQLNGNKVGNAVLDPGFSTNYTERILYAVFDITNRTVQAQQHQIVFGARVGAGKYSYAVNPFALPDGDVFAFRLTLTVNLANGSSIIALVTDDQWLVTNSPIVWENLYEGEVFDARLDQAGWSTLEFDPSTAPQQTPWHPARPVTLPAGENAILSARLFPPIRVVEAITPINTTLLAVSTKGDAASYFYDMGNNYAGVARIEIPIGLPQNATITVVCTEYSSIALVPWGPADLYNQQDLYISSGKEGSDSTWAPTFVYHGFRYVRVDINVTNFNGSVQAKFELPAKPPVVDGLFMRSDVKIHGNISFNDASSDGSLLEEVQRCILQTQIDNIHSIPTDCPQREKRGWMGDAQWTAEEASLNLDMGSLYANWVRSMVDVQTTGCTHGTPDAHGNLNMSGYCWVYHDDQPQLTHCNLTNSYCCLPTPHGADKTHPLISQCSPQYNQSDVMGSIPDIVPNNWGRGGSRGWPGTPTWSSALAIIPGVMLQYGQDLKAVEQFYEPIAAHVAFLQRQIGYGGIKGIPSFGLMGDWCAIEPFCPGSSDMCLRDPGWRKGDGDATTSFYFIKDLEVMVAFASVTGRTADAARYNATLAIAREAYYRAYYNTTSQDFGPTQTGNVLGIIASPQTADVSGAVLQLKANIASRNGTLSTGAVGARWLLQALTQANETKTALQLATQTAPPSWHWFAANGPGTLHEQWPRGPTPSGITPGSLNHPMMGGGIGVWLYTSVAGLRVKYDAYRNAPIFILGVEAEIALRIGAASATTHVAGGYKVTTAWRYHDSRSQLQFNCTIPPTSWPELTGLERNPVPHMSPKHLLTSSSWLMENPAFERATVILPWSADAVLYEGNSWIVGPLITQKNKRNMPSNFDWLSDVQVDASSGTIALQISRPGFFHFTTKQLELDL